MRKSSLEGFVPPSRCMAIGCDKDAAIATYPERDDEANLYRRLCAAHEEAFEADPSSVALTD